MQETNDLFDAHCHLSFAPRAEQFAHWTAENLAGAFSTTVDLSDYQAACELCAPWKTLKVGLGAHPWWVAQGKISPEEARQIAALANEARFIGEVGLDFGKNGLAKSAFATDEEAKRAQVDTLRTILEACASCDGTAPEAVRSGRVFSFHAVRSADVIMDLLEEYRVLSGNTIIFHWFSGSSAQLQRARELGCCFSVNAFMLATKRGREYAKAIPADQLLIETDLPEESEEADSEGQAFEAALHQYEQALITARDLLEELRGSSVISQVQQNAQAIFG